MTTTPVATAEARRRYSLGPEHWRIMGLGVVIVVMLVFLAVMRPTFFSLDNARVIGTQMATVAIMSIGMALLIISGSIDLSVGSIYGLCAIVAASWSLSHDALVAFGAAMVVGGLLGLANGSLVWRIRISPIIITIASLAIIRGITLTYTQGAGISRTPEGFKAIANALPLGIPVPIWVMLIGVVVAQFLLSRSTVGLHIKAMGGNRAAALSAGIPVRRILLGLFVVNGVLVALAASLAASRFGAANPGFGVGLELDVVTAVILGGVAFSGGEGSIVGVLLAVAALAVVNSGIVALGVDPYLVNVVKGGALLLAVSLDQVIHEQRERIRTLMALREATTTTDAGGSSRPPPDPA